jgi:hypothetical protein
LAAACGAPEDGNLALANAGRESSRLGSTTRAAPPSAVKGDPIVKGVPHGGAITQVAVAEAGDAALTFDTIGGVRLWPALDGSRTPVPVSVVAPDQLGLAHAGRDLLATILDEAGGVRVLRLGRDGSVRGSVQLRSQVPYKQALALDEGVLVRSEDQAVEWYSPDGDLRGKLVVEPSRRIQTIAARRGRAVAVISQGDKQELRWLLTMGGTLTWGASVPMPSAVKADLLALSPSHRRFAYVDAASTVQVYELGLVPTRVGNTLFRGDARGIGFIDEDNVAAMGSQLLWWTMPTKSQLDDPWAVAAKTMPTPAAMHFMDGGAVADGVAVIGYGAALAVLDRDKARYLGYQQLGVGTVGAAPSSYWISMSGSHVVWLDDKLAVKRSVELRKDPNGPWMYATPIGDRHVVIQTPVDAKYKIELVDVERPDKPIMLGTYGTIDRIEFSSQTNLLAVGSYSNVHRFKLDLGTTTATELAPIKTKGSNVQIRALDPELSGGVTALVLGWLRDTDDYYTLSIYRTQGKPTRVRQFVGRVVDIDERGNLYIATGSELVIQSGDKKLKTLELEGNVLAVSSDGSRFALQVDNDVAVVDADGKQIWRKPMWGAQQLLFSDNDKQLAVRANGGLLTLDAATGERTAMECAWSFALSSTPPASSQLGAAPVCEDPML